jgi:hypothetical protein
VAIDEAPATAAVLEAADLRANARTGFAVGIYVAQLVALHSGVYHDIVGVESSVTWLTPARIVSFLLTA